MGGKRKLEPNPGNHCFGCGGGNEFGMKLTFELDEDEKRCSGRFVLGARYGGGAGFAHGGGIAILLDEAMGKISKITGERAVNAEFNIEHRKPVAVDSGIVGFGLQGDVKS